MILNSGEGIFWNDVVNDDGGYDHTNGDYHNNNGDHTSDYNN